MTTIQASLLRVGDQVAERDGFLLTLVEVVSQTPKTITLRFAPCLSARQDMVTTVRKTSRVSVHREES